MIKKFCISLSLLAVQVVYAQRIEGLGDLKIGMSVQEFQEVPAIKAMNLREKLELYEDPRRSEIIRTTENTKFKETNALGEKVSGLNSGRIYSSDIQKYEFISELGILSPLGKDEYKISATFFKNKLLEIKVSKANSNFKNILIEKYGKPNVSNRSRIEICQNGYGAKTEHINGGIDEYWGRGQAIEAEYSTLSYGCGKYLIVTYKVYNSLEISQVDLIQREGTKKRDAEDAKENSGAAKL